jgi:archaellum component FlaC
MANITLPRIKRIDVPEIPYTKLDDDFEELLEKMVNGLNDQISSGEKQANQQIESAEKKYNKLAEDFNKLASDISKKVQDAKDEVTKFYKSQIESLEKKIKDLTNQVSQVAQDAIKSAKDQVESVKKVMNEQIEAARKKFNETVGKLQDEIKELKKKLKDAGQDVIDTAGDIIDDINPFDDLVEDTKEKLNTVKWVFIIGGAIVVIGGIALVWYLIRNRQKMMENYRRDMIEGSAAGLTFTRNAAGITRNVAGAQLAPISAAGDVIETHPQSAELVRRGATAYGTGGVSEVAGGLGSLVPTKEGFKEGSKDLKESVGA